ncbi:lipocalin family protein [Maribacter aquivivus]|uniref:lipocalin family protein n=1 Tax=Maribacter aquivivus TaxID=228958 RepID=UPI00248FDE5F|nr:lipocalin family protein [Maribacter aquivivus]
MMLKGYRFFVFCLLIFLSCSKEEDKPTSEIDIDKPEVDTSVTSEDIEGAWYVFAGEYMDRFIQVAPRYTVCGYDYLVFSNNGVYKEVLYSNNDCIPERESANWVLENGIITISNSQGEKEELPVIEFQSTELVVNFQYDIDNDGNEDSIKAYLRPYDPLSNNHIANSFVRDLDETELLKFNWKVEPDIDSFSSYEVYRSVDGTCTKEGATLLTEINDINNSTYIDFDPPATQNNLCYFLKVYSDDGLVGESELLTVNPKELIMNGALNLINASLDGEHIFLDWSEYNNPYFSHYEIVYANTDGSNLLFHEEDSIISIDSSEETSFLDTNPPYIENPFFAIYAYNIFGTNVVSNYEQVTFRRKELTGPIWLNHIEIDVNEGSVYLHGLSSIPDWSSYDVYAVLRMDYNESLLMSTTSNQVYAAGAFPFRKGFDFPGVKELVTNGQSNLYFLDPISLTENFSFGSFYLNEEFGLSGIIDYTYTDNGFLVIINASDIFVFQRMGQELILLDKQIHYENHHGDNLERLLQVNENEIIIGHKNEPNSILFKVDQNGLLQNKRVISIPFSSSYIAKYKNTSFYSESNNSLINYGDGTLYSTLSFQAEVQMPDELFALGLGQNSNYIFASTNDPDWFGSDVKTQFLKREVLLFDIETSQITAIKTKGYPIWVFENNLGEVFSISIPENQIITEFDVFVEKIEMP